MSWFAVPHPGYLANAFGETAVVYYCIDDYAALPDVDARAVAEMDAHLTSRADQVFVASSRMLRQSGESSPRPCSRRTAWTSRSSGQASDRRLAIAPGAAILPRPVIGFYGLIEEWIDLDLIADIAERRPRWTFLMIGRLAVDAGRLKALPNVVFAGPQPYRTLPDWAKAFDVAIIPYRLTRQVVNSAPLKLREYLATGKTHCGGPRAGDRAFAGLVRLARGPEQFISHRRALANDTDADRARRIEATVRDDLGRTNQRGRQILEHRTGRRGRSTP